VASRLAGHTWEGAREAGSDTAGTRIRVRLGDNTRWEMTCGPHLSAAAGDGPRRGSAGPIGLRPAGSVEAAHTGEAKGIREQN
jgi:hypothetical protein